MSSPSFGNKNKKSFANTQAGMSLVETLIAMGISFIIMAALTSMQVYQQRETRALSEKLATLDLEKLLISSLADGSICSAELSNNAVNSNAPYLIDPSNLPGVSIHLTSIHTSGVVGSPVLIANGASASTLSSSLKIASIAFKNFTSSGAANGYLADLEVGFDSSQLVRSLKPLALKMRIQTDGANNVSGCSGAAQISCLSVSASVPYYGGGTASCPAGYFVTGGGCQPATGGTVTATNPGNNGWTCSGSSSSGTITATAICCK